MIWYPEWTPQSQAEMEMLQDFPSGIPPTVTFDYTTEQIHKTEEDGK
jgi:hypothetical protein